jgi:hypothetical protein
VPPKGGRLEILYPLGGWTGQESKSIRFRLTVEGDPRPPQDRDWISYWDWASWEQEREEALLGRVRELLPLEPAALWKLTKLLDGTSEPATRPPIRPAEMAFLARYAETRARAEKEMSEADQACYRPVRAWFNGRALETRAAVNATSRLWVEPRAGENRLEVLDPATGTSLVRTWWQVAAAGPRLQAKAEGSSIRILEPGGKLTNATNLYRSANPAPGTYQVLWGGWEATHRPWNSYQAPPVQVDVEVLLDPGTDRERAFRFGRLCLPGAGEALLGTFHVEDPP